MFRERVISWNRNKTKQSEMIRNSTVWRNWRKRSDKIMFPKVVLILLVSLLPLRLKICVTRFSTPGFFMNWIYQVAWPCLCLLSCPFHVSVHVRVPCLYAPWTWTCTMDMDMNHGHGHAPWTRTCTMDMDMHHGHGHAQWTLESGKLYEMKFCMFSVSQIRNEISHTLPSSKIKRYKTKFRMLLCFAKRYKTKFRMFFISRNKRNFAKQSLFRIISLFREIKCYANNGNPTAS
jgi:hypothetical protein